MYLYKLEYLLCAYGLGTGLMIGLATPFLQPADE